MRRFWGWLGLNLGKRAGVVAMSGLLVTMLFGLGVTKLRFTTTNADYLNPKDPAWLANVAYEKAFGGDPMAVMFTMNSGKTVDELFTPRNIDEFNRVSAQLDKLKRQGLVYSYVTPLDAMRLSNVLLSIPKGGTVLDSAGAHILENAVKRDPVKASQAKRFAYLQKEGTLESSFPSDQQVLTNPKWVHFLLHEPDGKLRTATATFVPNDKHALLAVYLQGNISVNQEGIAANAVTNVLNHAHWQNAHTLTTGVPQLIATINNYLKHGILVLALVAAILMLSILALSFNVRWRFLAFAIVAVGTIWGFGLVGFVGIPLTLATIAALPTLLGIGMDYAIQMHSRIEEEVVLARSPHPVQASARGLGPALLVVTFDAVFSFMAMWFAKTPAIREFGSLLVVGIIAVCVCSIIATLAVLGIREYKSPTTKAKDFSAGILSRGVAVLGSVPQRFAGPFAVISIFVFLGGVAVEGHLHIQTDAISWVNPHSPAIKGINALKAGTGSANEIAVNLRTAHPFTDQTVDYAVHLSRQLEAKYKGVLLPATGLINTLDEVINNVPGTTEVPPTGAQIEALYLLSTPGIQRTTMANNGHSINIIFRAYPDTLSSLEPIVKDLNGGIKAPAGFQIAPGGIAIVGVGLIQNIEKSRVELTYLAVLFVGAFLAVRLRSIIRSLLSLVPVLTAVGAVSLVAVAFNLKLSPVTAVAGPLVVAVCTEFTSLILLRFVEERQRGLPPREAMDMTARRTGRAFVVSGATAVAGIGTLAASSMPLLSEFGTIVALNVTVALLSALIILPPILVAAETRGWVTRGLLHKEEEPFIEYGIEQTITQGPPPASAPLPMPVGAAGSPFSATAWPAPPVGVPTGAAVPGPGVPSVSATGWEEHPVPVPDAGVPDRWTEQPPGATTGWPPPDEHTAVPPGWGPVTVPVEARAEPTATTEDNGAAFVHVGPEAMAPPLVPAGYEVPQHHAVVPGYDVPSGYQAPHEQAVPAGYAAPPGYTVAPGYEAQQGYGYEVPPGYSLPPGYVAAPGTEHAAEPARGRTRSARLAALAARIVGLDDR